MPTVANSLAFRLFVLATVWALVLLGTTTVLLTSFHRGTVERSFDSSLDLYLRQLVHQSLTRGLDPKDVQIEGQPLFQEELSGWYWQIKPLGKGHGTLIASQSLTHETLPLPSRNGVPADATLTRKAYLRGPNNMMLRVVEREIRIGEGAGETSYSFAVAADAEEIEHDVREFRTMLVAALAVLGIGLVLGTLFQLRVGLRPLRRVQHRLASIRSGETQTLEGSYPAEITPLQTEINALIRSNHEIVERARTHVGNLAHGLKTPLSVITNEARTSRSVLAAKVIEQAEVMRGQITAYLDRARMAARVGTVAGVTEVAPVLDAMRRALAKIYEERGLELSVSCPDGVRFHGERQDLEEMIGNLFDNACKWAAHEVHISVAMDGADAGGPPARRLFIHVDDDGPGLGESARAKAVQRGRRLDETKPGSGLGLSIVADLAHLYKGAFDIDASPQGGLRVTLRLPAA